MLADRRVIFPRYPMINQFIVYWVMHKWHRNRVANVMDAAKKFSIFFYSDGVIENLFSS